VRPKVAVLHHPHAFFPPDLSRQVGEHAELIWVVGESCVGDASTRFVKRLGTVVDIVGLDAGEAARRLGEHGIQGVVSFVDDHIELAAALAERLGLRYHTPSVAARVVDKRLQRAAFQEAGIPGPGMWALPASLTSAETAELVNEMNFPAVLKPEHGSGSVDMHRLKSADELMSILVANGGVTDYVVEEYVPNDLPWDHWYANYFSVESVISAGNISHVAITSRFPIAEPFRESGNIVPGILAPELHEPVYAMVDAAIAALGVTDSIIHTEIKLSADGPKLIEVNGRLGGRPPFVLGRVSNVNLFRVACDVAVGNPVSFDGLAECDGVGFWFMVQPPMSARRVTRVQGLEELAALPGVDIVSLNRGPGETVDWREGTASNVVTVRGRADDHDALEKTYDSIGNMLKVDYEP
jgi:biotin carboxylase